MVDIVERHLKLMDLLQVLRVLSAETGPARSMGRWRELALGFLACLADRKDIDLVELSEKKLASER